jgi:hypothetical protein
MFCADPMQAFFNILFDNFIPVVYQQRSGQGGDNNKGDDNKPGKGDLVF